MKVKNQRVRKTDDGKQIVWGIVLSYILIIFNAIYGLLITPFIVDKIGVGSYGVYKTIASLGSSLMIIDLGLGNTIQRYVAKYIADKEDKRKIGNFISMTFLEGGILSCVAIGVCVAVYFNLDAIFSKGFSSSEIDLAKNMFAILSVTIVAHIFENILNGVITGYNKFVVANGIKLFRLILRLFFTYVGLIVWKSPILLVSLDLILVFVLIICESFYIRFKLNQKLAFISFDVAIFKESIVYSFFMLIASFVSQINAELGNVFIGAYFGAVEVAIYSTALTIYMMFAQIGSAVSGVMLPKVTKLLKQENSHIEEYVIKVGRIQFMLIGAALGAFITLGKPFVAIWMGEEFLDAYYITIILMIPTIFEICINVCLAVLRATNKLKFRTVVLVGILVFNVLMAIFAVPKWGYYTMAIATAFSYFVGHVIIMGFYYKKQFSFSPIRAYGKIFSRTWICILLSSIGSYIVSFAFQTNSFKFFFGAVAFVMFYVMMLLIFLPKNEKQKIYNIIKRR
ncbi:MAG: hypothetical protein DBX97_03055 [Collinsella tanakaei]|nr:MAG: hypothetical protein DBX97_03055 [Collinsella tanakaei]